MERVPLTQKVDVQNNILSAWEAIDSGVVAATSSTRTRYWNKWVPFAGLFNIDPFLQNVDPIERDIVVTAFAARVRSGALGRGKQVSAGEVRSALAAISKTIELAGQQSPLYRGNQKYTLPIERCIEGMKRQDPPATLQLALPVTVTAALHETAYPTSSPKHQAVDDLASVAFYYLLRVGEYTQPRMTKKNGKWVRATRTVQFHVGDIGFFKNGKVLSRWSPLKKLLQADGATLKITNQKNGRMGETVYHETVPDLAHGPIQSLARRVHNILHNGGSEDNLLCDYITEEGVWKSITSTDMRKDLRATVVALGLSKRGIDPDLVGVHSLRAGGAMAMKLHGLDDTTIMKMGRWTSLTFLMYIHSQIAHLGKNISSKMSTPLPFTNIAKIESAKASSSTPDSPQPHDRISSRPTQLISIAAGPGIETPRRQQR